MRKKKAALYNPYLDILGGGERHILSIMQVLEKDGYDVDIFWNTNLAPEIETKFGLTFQNLQFRQNIFGEGLNSIQKAIELKKYDIFLYVTDGSYFGSFAKQNFVFCMVPDKKLYSQSMLNKLKRINWRFITNSRFTQYHLKNWGIQATVVYPYLDSQFLDTKIENIKKDKIILSVGRFFGHLHSKKHEVAINTFKLIKGKNILFKDFKLIIAGGLQNSDKEYFEKLVEMAKDDPSIILSPNVSYSNLMALYDKSLIFWHMTGLGVDANLYPEQTEHLGITPLEAMAKGCVTFAPNVGGPKELISDGQTGFLFSTEKELIEKTEYAVENPDISKTIAKSAHTFVAKSFNYDVFSQTVKKVLIS